MTADERNIVAATAGLVVATIGAFLPWARIGGRNRSGFNTADTFISLAQGALPDQVAWVGRWWYVPALLALACWASVFAGGHIALRAAGASLVLIGLAMWWLFVWAGEHYGLLDMQLPGPLVASVGFVVIANSCRRRRRSVLTSREHSRATDPE